MELGICVCIWGGGVWVLYHIDSKPNEEQEQELDNYHIDSKPNEEQEQEE